MSDVPEHIEREIIEEMRNQDRIMRRKALVALWAPEKITRIRGDGVKIRERGRDEEWTLFRAIRCSIGLIFNIGHKKINDHSWHCNNSWTLAYWDAWDTYGGYNAEVVELVGWFGAETFNDGEWFI